MIEYKSGDLLAEEAEALVNTVNCVGFMGRGMVRTVRDRMQS
jgi:O-acetyl-ADP-ribose deacetylase (regulator of RNase III)